MASKEAQEYLAQVRAYQEAAIGAAGAAPTLADMRAGADAVMETIGTMPDGVSIESEDVDGLSALWCRPEGARPDAVVLYLHGGGYVLQSATSHRKLTSHLAPRTPRIAGSTAADRLADRRSARPKTANGRCPALGGAAAVRSKDQPSA